MSSASRSCPSAGPADSAPQLSTPLELPKIYAFSNVKGGGDGIAYAMAEDGTVLGSHWCSSEFWVPNDLGVIEGARPDRHEHYATHYPNGYEMVFVPAAEVDRHPGIRRAYQLNQEQARAAKAGLSDGPAEGQDGQLRDANK